MNFQQLRSVREAARRNYNLTEVANALFTSQPGVSRQIRELEDELGVIIFERNGKRLTGLTEPGHQSTARDVAVMASHIIKEHPDFYKYYSVKEYRYNNIRQDNRNLLLRRDPSVDGMKTGYTEAAGYCLIASAQRDYPNGKRRLISVVLNTTSMDARANESQKLLNWGYQAFDTLKLFDAGHPVATPAVWKGKPIQQMGKDVYYYAFYCQHCGKKNERKPPEDAK